MVYRTGWWMPSILTLTYLIYAGVITAAILSREYRAFFVAFAVFGFAYGVCVYSRIELVTDRLLTKFAQAEFRARLDDRMQEKFDASDLTEDISVPLPLGYGSANPFADFPRQLLSQIRPIGHSLFALVIGFVAGAVADGIVWRKSQRPPAVKPP
jgi:hypothetical protein